MTSATVRTRWPTAASTRSISTPDVPRPSSKWVGGWSGPRGRRSRRLRRPADSPSRRCGPRGHPPNAPSQLSLQPRSTATPSRPKEATPQRRQRIVRDPHVGRGKPAAEFQKQALASPGDAKTSGTSVDHGVFGGSTGRWAPGWHPVRGQAGVGQQAHPGDQRGHLCQWQATIRPSASTRTARVPLPPRSMPRYIRFSATTPFVMLP